MSISKVLAGFAVVFDPFGFGFSGLQGWLDRRRVRRELKAAGPQSFKVDVCEPGGVDTCFGTMTLRDGTKIRGTL